MFKKILIANDGSEKGFKALVAALQLARSHEAQAHMICVEERGAQHDEIVSERNIADPKFVDVIAKAEAEAKLHGVRLVTHIVAGRPASAIAAFITADGFDLLVTGFKSHSALYHRILGKTADRLVEHAPCSVLVIK